MTSDLPAFRKVQHSYAMRIARSVFAGAGGAALLRLIHYDDNHFRAVFDARYFALQPEQTAPSKSQWNTLKKKLKRRNRSIFVFRAHGELDCQQAQSAREGRKCLYLDFGFMWD